MVALGEVIASAATPSTPHWAPLRLGTPTFGTPTLGTPTLETIHQGLLRDYYAQLGEKNYQQQTAFDPILGDHPASCLRRGWRTLYSRSETSRMALLDELIQGLSVEPRHAIPAQAVIRFSIPPAMVRSRSCPKATAIRYDGSGRREDSLRLRQFFARILGANRHGVRLPEPLP